MNKKITLTIIIAGAFFVFNRIPVVSAAGEPNCAEVSYTGDGSEGSPYQITTLAQLQCMSQHLSSYFMLAGNIDASATSAWNDGAGFEPVGDIYGTAFSGTITNAGGYTISNLTINRTTAETGSTAVGLFGYIDGAEIHDLNLSEFNVTGDFRVGALVGSMKSGLIEGVAITDCNVYAQNQNAGGMVGMVDGGTTAIQDSTVSGGIAGSADGYDFVSYAGGLLGMINIQDPVSSTTVTVQNCNVSNSVRGGSSVGGLAGLIRADDGGTVINISSSSFEGAVTTQYGAGGFIADVTSIHEGDQINITQSHSSGSVGVLSEDSFSSGGFISRLSVEDAAGGVSVSNCYSEADVIGGSYVGGFWGWINNTSGDISVESSHATGDVEGYKYVGGFIGGMTHGTISSKSYATGDVSGNEKVGGFVGFIYEGDGTISEAYATGDVISGDDLGGFVGYMEAGGIIRNCYAKGDVLGSSDDSVGVGGFAGKNFGDIYNAYATGEVNGNNSVGGFVGENGGGSINSSLSSGMVDGGAGFKGGFVGYGHDSTYDNCGWVLQDNLDAIRYDETLGEHVAEITYNEEAANSFFDASHEVYTAGGSVWDFDTIWFESEYHLPTLEAIVEDDPSDEEPVNEGSAKNKFIADILEGFIDVKGSDPTSTTKVVFHDDYLILEGETKAAIPAGTKMTRNGGGGFDFSEMELQDVTNDIKEENGGKIAGAVSIGVPDKKIQFSKDITITIPVGNSYNGKTLTIYYQNAGEKVWQRGATCLVSGGLCSFFTNHATEYSAGDEPYEKKKARVSSWKAYQYADQSYCGQKLKITIKGKNFNDDTKVFIGGKEASSVNIKSSKKLTAKFCLAKMLQSKTTHIRSISVKNRYVKAKRADKKIDLDNIPFLMKINN